MGSAYPKQKQNATCRHLTDLLRYDDLYVPVLTYVKNHSIMTLVGHLSPKGGCCDNNGNISNCRGGGKRTEYDSLLCQGDVAQERDARTQGWLKVAHRPDRIQGMEKTEAESVQVVSRINSSSVTARLNAYRLKPGSANNRCKLLPCVHYSEFVSRFATNCNAIADKGWLIEEEYTS
jgi:hypothetical protein